ncbi:hypothetical protein BU16DRAFT_580206 [Lophium mytilinum]|uniref:Uncharacterized protein n=1 Tax=Lophium mytilinum TaxID=390894 RepID=A0A6A6QYN1_9PEZI|nr:hypothetical protein BU16DRAFT_580206 [Lophium mytilinum]
MGDGGTTVAFIIAGVLGAIVAWIGVHYCRRWIKKRHVDMEREDYLKETQAAQDAERGRDRKRKRRPREKRDERDVSEWQPPVRDVRMPEDYIPQPPLEELPPQPLQPLEPPQPTMPTMPEPVHVDYIAEVDELPEVIAGLQGRRVQERECRSCSTDSSSSSSSSEAARRSRTSDVEDVGPRDYMRNHRPNPRPNPRPPPRMPPRVSRGFNFNGMPPMAQDTGRGGQRGRGWRYGTTSPRGRIPVLNKPDRTKWRNAPMKSVPEETPTQTGEIDVRRPPSTATSEKVAELPAPPQTNSQETGQPAKPPPEASEVDDVPEAISERVENATFVADVRGPEPSPVPSEAAIEHPFEPVIPETVIEMPPMPDPRYLHSPPTPTSLISSFHTCHYASSLRGPSSDFSRVYRDGREGASSVGTNGDNFRHSLDPNEAYMHPDLPPNSSMEAVIGRPPSIMSSLDGYGGR